MNRRQFLTTTIPTIAGAVSGCLGDNVSCRNESWSPVIEVEELELSPGNSEVLDIQAKGITGFQFDTRLYKCGSSDAPVKFGDVETSPQMDYQVDSCPPVWSWNGCTSVTVRAPVYVATDASPGEYEYGFRIREDVAERHTRNYEYTITVTES